MDEIEFKENELSTDELDDASGAGRAHRRCIRCGRTHSFVRIYNDEYGLCLMCYRELGEERSAAIRP